MEIVQRDCGDYLEFAAKGVAISENGSTMVMGLEMQDELRPGMTRYSIPPLVAKIPKKLPQNVTLEQWMDQFLEEYFEEVKEACRKGGITNGEKPQGLSENSIVRNQTALGFHQVEAHNMDQEPRTNLWAMKELDSALHNCAKGKCAGCEGMESFSDIKAADNMAT